MLDAGVGSQVPIGLNIGECMYAATLAKLELEPYFQPCYFQALAIKIQCSEISHLHSQD
jgi:hypothetical protein